MATMTHDRSTGTREFVVPLAEPPAAGHFRAPAELVITVGPPGGPRRVAVRYFPSGLEFQLRLLDLVKGTALEAHGPALSMDAAQGQPVVTFEGDGSVVRLLPARIDDLEMLEIFLAEEPKLLRKEAFALASIEFRRPE
jgi:hypothetical protein